MLSRRLLWALPVLLLAAAGYSGWLAWQVKGDLERTDRAASSLQASLGDARQERDRSIADLQGAAASARERTSSGWWGGLTHVPFIGDDAAGIRALSVSLDLLASNGATPLVETIGLLGKLTGGGRIDLGILDRITPRVSKAHMAFDQAADQVRDRDASSYAGPVRSRFEDYVDLVTEADHVLASAETATEVLPAMLGADGPRDYLLVFQNNAEIRATGGLPGSWALVHAEDGELSMREQGTAGRFGVRTSPVLPMLKAELAVYDNVPGIYFQSSNFTPDFPRAAELWTARFEEVIPGAQLDGVIALDPVAMSYLLRGTGPVEVQGRTLTPENAVTELLSRPYLELDPVAQDALFADAARGLFDAMTGDLRDPVEFVRAVARAAEEGRLLVAPAAADEREALAGTRVRGALSGDDGSTPHVDIGLNDATASKMSYYLRYDADVTATACSGDTQQLRGSMSLSQLIAPEKAAQLPDSVTGGGQYGNDVGDQLVSVRLYAPYGGKVGEIRMDGKALDPEVVNLDGRPVVTLIVQLSTTDDVVINWMMETGPGQDSDGALGLTPSIVPGNNDETFASAC